MSQAEPAYILKTGTGLSAPIVFASPHSGQIYPPDMREALRVPLTDLQRIEDAFVDELFSVVTNHGASLLTAQYARSYVDLNRNPDELDIAMFKGGLPRPAMRNSTRVEAGLGCLPRIGASGEPIYGRKLSLSEGEHRLSHVHDAYHDALSAELDHKRAIWGQAILIDCHSMPSKQPGRGVLPDIVLGDRFGASCTSHLMQAAERAFRQRGYNVAKNAPYAGGYTTCRYGRPRKQVHALQIEINRGLYMDEVHVEKSHRFYEVQANMNVITAEITNFARALANPPLAAE